jgi:hypothetical protein
VCVIGVDGDATADDMNVVRSRYDYACAMAGRKLRMLGHNQAPTLPAGYTDCPGSELQNWINAGMPYVEDDDVPLTPIQAIQLDNIERYLQSLVGMTPAAKNISNGTSLFDVPNEMVTTIESIDAKETVGGITEAQLRAIIRDEISKTKLS